MRRSVRGGSVKVGGKMGGQAAAHAYSEHMKENGGEIGRSLHDFDIKMLQQKRQVRRPYLDLRQVMDEYKQSR